MKTLKYMMAAVVLQAACMAVADMIPGDWRVDVGKRSVFRKEIYQGESVRLEATFFRDGKEFTPDFAAPMLYWQTNGMGRSYFSAPAVVSSNAVCAVWDGSKDCGARYYHGFIGETGVTYRAEFEFKMVPSPGFTPNALPLPVEKLDFAAVAITNAPFYTRAETDARIIELAPSADLSPATNYTDSATNAATAAAVLTAANYTDAATNALAASIVIPETPPQRWSRPDAWSFHAVCDYDSETPGETTALSTNEYGMVFAERYNTVVRSNRFRFAADWLDPYRSTDALELSYTVPAATNLLDVFFFPSNGVYRVHALNAEADTAHSRDIVISGIGSTSRIFAKEYTADANTARNSWQTHSQQYIATTTNYAPKCTQPGRGNTDPIFLAPGVVMSAAHWGLGNLRTGDYSITNNNHNVTITIGAWERLDTWAARNGFTQEEIAACYKINDVAVAPVVSAAKIPTALCPLLRAQRAAAIKEHSITGLLAYRSPQEGGRPQPVIMYAPGRWTSGSAITAENAASLYCRTDIRDLLLAADWLFPSHGGDSGKPVLYIHAGVEHLLSFCSSGSQNPFSGSPVPMASGGTGLVFCYGPDLLAARAIISAYCTAHGTSLREEPEEE